DETFRSALADGEVALVAEALARRAGVDFETAWNQFVCGGRQLANLLRMAGVPRPFAAQVAATLGDSTARGPGELISRFDALSQEQVERARDWLRLDRTYRVSIAAIGGADGNASD
ncbi:MAG: hypothetical protein H0U83_01505, partial [Sphingomonas sp.]|nr:hypothetical protein [Sphingomonas sp.]